MKILFVPDIHGHGDDVIKLLQQQLYKYDKIVFMGDYVDSFVKTNDEIIDSLMNIMFLKIKYPDKIVLLLGNHDIQYLYLHDNLGRSMICSGFRTSYKYKLFTLFTEYIHMFDAAFQYNNILATHAGLRQDIYENLIKNTIEENESLADTINKLFKLKHSSLFLVGFARLGSSYAGSIFWADFNELKDDPLIGYGQVVGHTPGSEFRYFINNNSAGICIDVIPDNNNPIITENMFYELDDKLII